MQPWQMLAGLLPGLAGALFFAIQPTAGDPAGIAWRADWNAARVEARQSGKPLFVVFR